ncbi:putative G-protein coupled receptors family 1 profile domain-containing protein [Seiridium cardinale]
MKPHETAGIATTAVATVFVGLRIFTKLRIAHEKLDFADYLNIAAAVSTWVFAVMIFPFDPWIDRLLQAEVSAVGPDDPNVLRVYGGGFDLFNAVTSIFFALALTFARLSILVFYLRLSPIRSFHWAVHGVIVFLSLETVISVVLSLLIFDSNINDEMKAADQALGIFYGVSNILVDVAILVLPIGVVVPLQMSLQRKIAVLCLFGVGAVVCAISTYRVTILTFISSKATTSNPISNQLILSFAETNGAIICGCVPIIPRFFTQHLPEIARPLLFACFRPSISQSLNGAGPTNSTTIENNRRRRERNRRRQLINLKDSGFASGHDGTGSREGIVGPKGGGYEMDDLDLQAGHGNVATDMNQSFDSLERNVLGRGRADTRICAETEVFASDQEMGITCIHDTSVSYGPKGCNVTV